MRRIPRCRRRTLYVALSALTVSLWILAAPGRSLTVILNHTGRPSMFYSLCRIEFNIVQIRNLPVNTDTVAIVRVGCKCTWFAIYHGQHARGFCRFNAIEAPHLCCYRVVSGLSPFRAGYHHYSMFVMGR